MSEKTVRTGRVRVDPENPDKIEIEKAARLIREGGLVAFPTETVYGLGANAKDEKAVGRIFAAKGRPPDNPLIVHVASRQQVFELAKVSAAALKLMEAFWPGPLTLILPAKAGVPAPVTAGLSTVAVRMPRHRVALALIEAAGVPVAAPSANLSGRPSPTTAEHVLADLGGKIDLVLDGGPTGLGVESTVLDLTARVPTVLRPGGVTPDEIRSVTGRVRVGRAARGFGGERRPRSPGLKYTHYAPRAPLVLVEGDPKRVDAKIKELAGRERSLGKKVGILACSSSEAYTGCGEVVAAGRREDPATVAAGLYAALRRLDEMGVDVILAEGIGEGGMGLAVMNRLRRAAAQIIRV